MLAALPKGPEYYSPVRHPDRALKRRNLVLSEMQQDGWITEAEEARAKAAPLGLKIEPPANSVAPYFVEEVRRQLEQQFGAEEVHGAGLRIYTTLDYDLQVAANHAVLNGAAAYERRHGWKNRVQNIILAGQDPAAYVHPDWTMPIEKDTYFHALVTDVSEKEIRVRIGQREAYIEPADWAWTQLKTGDALLKKGDIAYVRILAAEGEKGIHAALEQDSGAQASLMAMDNSNGEVLAMVGGRDFSLSQFNRATQAERQVGSSFKPYVYTAAVEAGTKPTDHVLDVPTTFSTPSGPYTPHNYEP
ncbi:penicillin-binding transpeptidase domain-containing protein, partial [Terriglobus sp. YAF25]|uniref:penicillin-binding transpeptidase domain-containing protein n=1 Tax=Terriglobus sp. YAF25 TaxID=3233080 RepID=UPI003F9832B1